MQVEIEPHPPNMNLVKNQLAKHIIRRKYEVVMTWNIVHEELYFISQVKPMKVDEACKDDHWIQEMKEQLDWIGKNEAQ